MPPARRAVASPICLIGCLLAALLLDSGLISATEARDTSDQKDYQTSLTRWRAADGAFDTWDRQGTALASDGGLRLAADATDETDPFAPGAYLGGNYYNGGSYRVGVATGPEVTPDFAFTQAIASWNAVTPPGTWIEALISAKVGSRWSRWYNLGIWAADEGTVRRHSVKLQGDADGGVVVDTLVVSAKGGASAYKLRFRLFSASPDAIPSVRNAGVAISTALGKVRGLTPGNPALWDRLLAVPECSQMVYPDGGNVWCSPTSTSMVLGYWAEDSAPCETRVRAAVAGVYDWVYDGHGNWPFNTAYAGTQGHEAYVTRLTSMAQIEPWIASGVPVVISLAWKATELTGAAVPSSSGHLVVVVGFDSSGNPIANDPAAASDHDVRRTYLRREIERLWLETSGGAAYLIYPPDTSVPTP